MSKVSKWVKVSLRRETWAELQRLKGELIASDPNKKWTMDEVIRYLLSHTSKRGERSEGA